MKQSLQLRTSQHLALTPQLQQSIRLLQLSTLELQQELQQILADNPLLERLDDPLDHSVRLLADGAITSSPAREFSSPDSDTGDTEKTSSEIDTPSHNEWDFNEGFNVLHSPDDEDARPQLEAQQLTLREAVLEQMRMTELTLRDRALLEILIETLDEHGYLTETLEEILARLPKELTIAPEELQFALNLIQSFEPPGIGARNIGECLSLQLKRLPNIPFITRRHAVKIVEEHLLIFAQRDFTKLKKAINCDEEDLRGAQEAIMRCQPHPGEAFIQKTADYIVPEVIAKITKNGWQVNLNQNVIPRLRVNVLYASIVKQNKGGAALNSQLQEAKWLIKNMHQRFDTILRVSQAIVERQSNFFSHGEVAMRPLVLREIADTLGLHESTISRVTTQKFMLTPHGIFELKYFFGSHVATEAGGEASSTAIRALIKQLIGAENPKQPFSDSKLADMLGEQGIVVARRTVAKYREALKIPSVNLRKAF